MARGGRIAGIKIELEADTGKATRELSKFERATKGVSAQLKDINKVLKLNPKSTETLTQKQRALKDQVEKTKQQLEAEKKALEQLQGADQTAKTVQQQEKLKLQIEETTAKLKEAEKAYKDFGSVGAQQVAAVGEKMVSFGQGLSDVGDALTQKVTLPLLALGVGSGKMALDYQDAMAKVSTLTDESVVSIEDLTDGVTQLSNETGKSGTELAEAMYQALSASVDTQDALAFTGQAARLAKAGFLDTAGSVDVLTTILNAYNKDASETAYISDLLVQTQNDGKTTVNELAASMGQVIPTAAAYNVGLENLTTAYALMTKNGINTANATTYINGMLTELADSGSTVAQILKNKTGKTFGQLSADGASLGDVLQILYDSVEGNSEEFANLWGNVRAGRGALTLAQAGADGFNTELQAMYASTGNVDEALQKLDTPAAQLRRTMNELKNTGVQLGTSLITLLQPAFDKITQVVQKVSEWFSNLSPQQQEMVVKIGMIVAALGPLLAIGGRLITGIGMLMTFAPAVIGAIGAIAGPVMIVIGVIAALIAIGVLLYKNWDKIKAYAEKVWTAIKEFFAETWEAIKTTAQTVWNAIKEKIITPILNAKKTVEEKIEALKTAITEKWEAIKSKAGELWDAIKEKVIQPIKDAKQDVEQKIADMKQNIEQKWEDIKQAIANKVEDIKEKLTKPFTDAKKTIDDVVQTVKGWFPINISNILSNIKLPHFRLTGSLNPTRWATDGFPKIEVDWYAKAMQNGMILKNPTIFGAANGRLLGGGEAGHEAIVGVNSLQSMIAAAVRTQALDPERIYEAVRQGASDATVTAYMDGRSVTNIVNRVNAMTAGQRTRLQGAY